MATTTFTDKVEILGSIDTNQLNVKAFSTQNQPLETWQSSAGTNLAQVTGDGRLEIGNNIGSGAPHDAVIDVNQDVTVPSSSPTSGIHSLGRITGTISSPTVNWTVDELQLNGTGGVSGLHTAKKVKLTNNNTGTNTTADLRGTDSSAVNTTGSGGAYVGQVTGVRGTASNAPSAYLTTAAGVEATVTNDTGATVTNAIAVNVATPTNTGTITNLYGLKIPDLTQGTNNYSVYTGTAPSYFGGQVQVGNGFKMAAGAASGKVLTSDTSGIGTWQTVSSVVTPTGTIQMYGASSAPTGWLLCDGTAVSRTTYSALFGVISTTFGAGDGSTTFNLPDLKGRVAIGMGQGSGLTNRNLTDPPGGTETHTLTLAQLPSHNHTSGTNPLVMAGTGSFGLASGGSGSTATLINEGSGSSHNNMQPYMVLNFIIKT